MKKKYKLMSMLVFGICSLFVMGFTEVHASTLVQEVVPDVYYTRRGGGKPYMSAKYNTYDMDGKTVYCIEPGVNITTHDYEGAIGWINSPYSPEVNQRIQLIGYYGYEYPGHNTLRYRMAAQALIWETTGGQIVEYWTEASGYGDYINVDYERNEILKLVNAHYEKPSFGGEIKQTVIGQTVTFEDSTNVLSKYEVYRSDNATSSISGNTLSVTPNTVGDVVVSLVQKSYTQDPTTIFVGIDEISQKMGLFGLNDPIVVSVKVKSVGGKVSLQKLDSKTLSFKPSGDAKLNGASYDIMDEYDFKVGELVTNGNSLVTSDYLPSLGTFYLIERSSSEGYLLDPTRYYFQITEDDLNPIITVHENVIEREVELYKVYADGSTVILKAEPNVTFEFYLKSSMELYATDTTSAKGRLSVVLPYGTYIVKQVNSTSNYEKIEDFEIVIDNNSKDPLTKIVSNAEISGKLKVIKVDEESNRVLVRDGIKFKIKNLDTNEYVCQNITYPTQSKVCVFETTDGTFTTPYVLSSGNYQIEELEDQEIEGYVWNSEPLRFSIGENSKFIYDDEFGVMLEVKFGNKQVKGEVEINKVGEKMVIENGTFRYEEIKLDGVGYNLYADGDIISQDGTLIYKDKDLVTSFITKDGYYKLTGLYLGKYCLIEEFSVSNHLVDKTPYCFEISYKDKYTEIVSLSFTLKNYLSKGDFELTKTDFSSGKPIGGALIEIFTEDDELIFSGRTDKETGKIVVKNLETGKKYKFLESKAPEGYVLNTEEHFFEITENGEIVKDTLSNEKIKSVVIIHKVDEDGNPVEGVEIGIYDLNDNLVFSGFTNSDGDLITELEYNDYYYKELSTKEGLILSTEKYPFSITNNDETLKFTLINEFEEIDVPNTLVNFDSIYIPIVILVVGAGLYIIVSKKRKK